MTTIVSSSSRSWADATPGKRRSAASAASKARSGRSMAPTLCARALAIGPALALGIESCAQQRRHLVERVGAVKQNDAEVPVTLAGGRHVAAPGGVGVAGLQAGDPGGPGTDEGVVVVEVEIAALDRELEAVMVGTDDARHAPLGEVGASERGEVARARVVALVLEPVRAGEVRAAQAEAPPPPVHALDEVQH